jgi:hypothetical protein
MIISLPVHTAVCPVRGRGFSKVKPVDSHVFVEGRYLPPAPKEDVLSPPQTIMSVPVHTAV